MLLIRSIIQQIFILLFFSFIIFSQNFENAIKGDIDIRLINGIPVPSDFPELEINTLKNGIGEGKLFTAYDGLSKYILIFENDGTPYFYMKIPSSVADFNLHANTILSFTGGNLIRTFDSTFTLINEIDSLNNMRIDPHEFLLLENGNYFILAGTENFFDMSLYVEGGNRTARVRDNIILEYNSSGNLIFSWNTKDYFHPPDAYNENLTSAYIDYAHINSIAEDYDSNLVISSRNLSEVTKIDRKTGEIIWRFGGLNNQFKLVDESGFFSYQHDIRPVKNKKNHYTLFDNGSYSEEKYTRVVEYKLDLDSMVAEKVWEYRAIPDVFTPFLGNAQRLSNGNTLINWSNSDNSQILEVDSLGNICLMQLLQNV